MPQGTHVTQRTHDVQQTDMTQRTDVVFRVDVGAEIDANALLAACTQQEAANVTLPPVAIPEQILVEAFTLAESELNQVRSDLWLWAPLSLVYDYIKNERSLSWLFPTDDVSCVDSNRP